MSKFGCTFIINNVVHVSVRACACDRKKTKSNARLYVCERKITGSSA